MSEPVTYDPPALVRWIALPGAVAILAFAAFLLVWSVSGIWLIVAVPLALLGLALLAFGAIGLVTGWLIWQRLPALVLTGEGFAAPILLTGFVAWAEVRDVEALDRGAGGVRFRLRDPAAWRARAGRLAALSVWANGGTNGIVVSHNYFRPTREEVREAADALRLGTEA